MPPTNSRLKLAQPGVRPEMFGKVLLGGPPGSGKTWSGLVIAETLAGPDGEVLVIDTEKESAQTYADLFAFQHLKWAPPFDPRHLAETIMDAGGKFRVVMVDSTSHFWRKKGGTLDIAGGAYTGWKDARPAQEDFTEAVLQTEAHVILCTRSKIEYAQERDGEKWKVVKLGMAIQQDDDIEYEVNVALEVDMQHVLNVAKSRCADVPVGTTFTAGHAGEFAQLYRDWLKGGRPVARQAEVQQLVESLNGIADQGEKVKAKRLFVECFGRPEHLLAETLPEAQTWVRERVALIVGSGDAGLPSGTGGTPQPAENTAGSPASPDPDEHAGADGPENPSPSLGPEAPSVCALCGSERAKLAQDDNGDWFCVNEGACQGRRQLASHPERAA